MKQEMKKAVLANAILILVVIVISLLLILFTNLNKTNNLKAEIYFENNLIKTIDLSKVDKLIKEDLYLKDDLFITIEYKKDAIRVISAPCHTHECVRTNWTSKPSKPIICLDLHYKIVIKGLGEEVDVVV